MSENQILVIAPRVRLMTVFHYIGIEDIPNLIKFVGKAPIINLDMSLQYKKTVIVPDSYVEVNSFGEVIRVLTLEELEKSYEIREISEWNEQNQNQLQEKPKRENKANKKGKK